MHRTREIPRYNRAQRYALRYTGKARSEATLRNLHAEFSALVAKTNKIWGCGKNSAVQLRNWFHQSVKPALLY